MSPPHEKTAEAAAAAFISNCDAKNFRTEAVKGLIAVRTGLIVTDTIQTCPDCEHQRREV